MPGNKEISSVRCVRRKCHLTKSLPVTWEVITKSNQQQIPQTPLAKPRCTTAVFVERCCHLLALWIDTCWFILVRDLSHVKSVVKRSPPTVTCTDTDAPTISEIAVRAMGPVAVPAKRWEKEKLPLPWCHPLTKYLSRAQKDPGQMRCHSRPSNVQFVQSISTVNSA